MKNTGASSIVCFTILVLPVLLDEKYWSFQYRVFYNTSITSIVWWRILELPVLYIDQRFWYSSIVNARYWYIQYCIYTIPDFRYCNIYNTCISSIVNIIILVIPVLRPAASYYPIFIVLAHWNNSPRLDMSLHSDTLFWFRADQSFLFLLMLCALRRSNKCQFYSLWFDPTGVRTHDLPH